MIILQFEDFLRCHNINLNIMTLPSYIRGFAYYNGFEYLVLINNRCSSEQQKITTVHELIHIFENHFSCPKEYEDYCEKQVHTIINELQIEFI